LYKFGTRYYDPTLGRWTQQDPVRGHLDDPNSLNRYLYAGDDPVNLTDPSGKDAVACVYAFIVALAGLLVTLLTFIGLKIQESVRWGALFAAWVDATATAATIALAEAAVEALAAAFWWIIARPLVRALVGQLASE